MCAQPNYIDEALQEEYRYAESLYNSQRLNVNSTVFHTRYRLRAGTERLTLCTRLSTAASWTVRYQDFAYDSQDGAQGHALLCEWARDAVRLQVLREMPEALNKRGSLFCNLQ